MGCVGSDPAGDGYDDDEGEPGSPMSAILCTSWAWSPHSIRRRRPRHSTSNSLSTTPGDEERTDDNNGKPGAHRDPPSSPPGPIVCCLSAHCSTGPAQRRFLFRLYGVCSVSKAKLFRSQFGPRRAGCRAVDSIVVPSCLQPRPPATVRTCRHVADDYHSVDLEGLSRLTL